MFLQLDYFEIGEIEPYVNISVWSYLSLTSLTYRANILRIWQLVTWIWRIAQELYCTELC